jgi:hypothetical protein
MKVLDLFCGMGGWSDGFAAEGFKPVGVDIEDYGYKYELILKDIREIDGRDYQEFDVIIGSPPCRDFSTATQANKGFPGRDAPDPEKGLELVREFTRVVEEARPRLWAMENVTRMEKYYDPKPIWRFLVSKRGRRSLWGNLPMPTMTPDFRFNIDMEYDYTHLSYRMRSAHRAKMPLRIARFIAQVCEMKQEGEG